MCVTVIAFFHFNLFFPCLAAVLSEVVLVHHFRCLVRKCGDIFCCLFGKLHQSVPQNWKAYRPERIRASFKLQDFNLWYWLTSLFSYFCPYSQPWLPLTLQLVFVSSKHFYHKTVRWCRIPFHAFGGGSSQTGNINQLVVGRLYEGKS